MLASPNAKQNAGFDAFHALHYLAACVLLLSVCTPHIDMLTLLRHMSPLEKYGFIILCLVVADGTRYYMGHAFEYGRDFVRRLAKLWKSLA